MGLLIFTTLVFCTTMVIFGVLFLYRPPKEINDLYGYRTQMSSKNKDTWSFAHHYAGKVWFISGLLLLPVSAIVIAVFWNTPSVSAVFWLVFSLQMLAFLLVIPLTEHKLHQVFDRHGRRRKEYPQR